MRVAVCLSILCFFAPTCGLLAGDTKKAIPAADAIAAAEKLVKDVFKDEYVRTDDASKRAFAQKLLENARSTNDDEAARYVLFLEAIELAGQVGDLNRAFNAADELAAEFAVNGSKLKAPAIEKAAASVSASEAKGLVELALSTVYDAVAADDYDSAARIIKAVDSAARKSKNLSVFSRSRGLAEDLDKLKSRYQKAQAAIATLESNPDDAEANLLAGKHLCFVKGEWNRGLSMLVKGSDASLRVLARQEMEIKDANTERLALADGWYELAAAEILKTQLQLRAYRWYKAALPDATGLSKAKVDKRLAELENVAIAQGEWAWMHAEISKRIREGRVKKWETVGGAFSRETFEDVPPEGAILIGFRYTTINNGRHPGFIQPIWRMARSEVYGQAYGTLEKGAKVEETKAKPGYAVGSIYTRGGGGFDALKPIYMRLTDSGLDTNDRYEGPHIGGQGGGEGTFGGGGHPIVGLHGKMSGKERKIDALSIVTLTSPLKRRE